jgi:glycosyltransferase involved in cell wall biosynthesis
MNKNKITFFLQDLSGGGAEKMMVQLANNFYINGYEIDMVLVKRRGPYQKELHEGINVVAFNINRTYKSIFNFLKYLIANRPKAIISTLPHINIIAVIINLLLFKKTKVLVREASPLGNYLSVNYPLIRIAALIAPFIYLFADKCVAISVGLKNELQKRMLFSKGKVICIYNPVINDKVEKFKKNEKVNTLPYFKKKVQVIISVGRLEHVKDFQTLIKAFSIIRNEINSKLIIVGEGSLENILKIQVNSLGLNHNVLFVGFVDNLYEYLQSSDLFVLSSKYEGFGNVLVEALFSDLPIVSTDCPYGPSEILENGKYGCLVPVGDYKSMAEECISILNGEKKFTGLRERALEFHVNKIAKDYLNVILSLYD